MVEFLRQTRWSKARQRRRRRLGFISRRGKLIPGCPSLRAGGRLVRTNGCFRRTLSRTSIYL